MEESEEEDNSYYEEDKKEEIKKPVKQTPLTKQPSQPKPEPKVITHDPSRLTGFINPLIVEVSPKPKKTQMALNFKQDQQTMVPKPN